MSFKKIVFFIAISFSMTSSAFALTIINQTETKKVLKLEEAYRPISKTPGRTGFPVPFNNSSHKIKIPAQSVYTTQIEPCSILLITVYTTEKAEKNVTKTISNQTCYEPYDFEGYKENQITNDWGIVIYKPIVDQKPVSGFGRDYAMESFARRQAIEQGYGIKCFHPRMLEDVTVEELSKELLN